MKTQWLSRHRLLSAGVAGLVLAGLAFAALPSLRWRGEVLVLRATGQITDIGWADLLHLLRPDAHQSLERLASSRDPYSVLTNPLTRAADVQDGQRLFAAACARCHGPGGEGSMAAPALARRAIARGSSDWALYRVIRDGVAGTAMPSHGALRRDEVWRLSAYVGFISREQALQEPAAGAASAALALAGVSAQALKDAKEPAADWLTFSGSYDGRRHSALTGITPGNVAALAPAWITQIAGNQRLESSPLVKDGVMFLTTPVAVIALDAGTGQRLWAFERNPPADSIGFPGLINRGVALLGDRVFWATADAHLIALDSRTGAVHWDIVVIDYRLGHYITGAPLAFDDTVVVGTSVRFARGMIASFDARTGASRWRFVTIPAEGEPGNDTWPRGTWEKGGGPAWMTGTYDPGTDTLFWGVGNPKPDYDASVRRGDNLYTNSVVALQGASGRLLWHFQFTPNDDHDWDATQVPVIADSALGAARLLIANRNGFYYVLDRRNGAFVAGRAFVRQTWASGLDARGRPIRQALPRHSEKGYVEYPSNVGATSWWPPTMDAQLGLFFVPAIERGQIAFPPNRNEAGSNVPAATGTPHYTVVRALNAFTGEPVWERRSAPRMDDAETAGLLSTRTGLVFWGDQQRFSALEAATGRELWSFNTGGTIAAAPVTFAARGRQYVVVSAGSSVIAFAVAPPLPPAAVLEARAPAKRP